MLEAEDEVTPLRLARIDAARGIGERIEYEVPADPAGQFPTLLFLFAFTAQEAESHHGFVLSCQIAKDFSGRQFSCCNGLPSWT